MRVAPHMKVRAMCRIVPIPCAPFSFHVRYRFPESASAWAAPFLVRSCAGLFPWPPGGSCAKGLCCSTVPRQGQSPQPTVLPEEGRFPHPAERVRQNFPWQAQGLPHSLRLPEGIRPAPLRQGNRPRLWLQSSVSSMCSRRASPGHAGVLQVSGEAPPLSPHLALGCQGVLHPHHALKSGVCWKSIWTYRPAHQAKSGRQFAQIAPFFAAWALHRQKYFSSASMLFG